MRFYEIEGIKVNGIWSIFSIGTGLRRIVALEAVIRKELLSEVVVSQRRGSAVESGIGICRVVVLTTCGEGKCKSESK